MSSATRQFFRAHVTSSLAGDPLLREVYEVTALRTVAEPNEEPFATSLRMDISLEFTNFTGLMLSKEEITYNSGNLTNANSR